MDLNHFFQFKDSIISRIRSRPGISGALLLLVLANWAWNSATTSSITIDIPDSDYRLTYSFHFGLNMNERFYFSHRWWPLTKSSGWLDIFERPYQASITLYRSQDKRTYFLGHANRVFAFNVATGQLLSYCSFEALVWETAFRSLQAPRFEDFRDDKRRVHAPPVRPDLAKGSLTGDFPSVVPPSPFYRDLDYVGEFTLIYDDRLENRRGAGFIPASKAFEKPFGLDGECG